MKKGIFITIEGPDGSGKSTQIESISAFLSEIGIKAVITREPGGTNISEKIRELVLDKNYPEMDHKTEALLYAAARAQHVAEVIKPALARGQVIICDRFMDSSIVYQGYGRRLGEPVRMINEFAVDGCMPDITFLMILDPNVGKSRIEKEMQDRLELEQIEFHTEVFRGYMELEKRYPERVIGINASRSIEKIHGEIRQHLTSLLRAKDEIE